MEEWDVEFDESLFYDPQLPLPEDIPIKLPLLLEETIQLPEPIKEVDEMPPNPLISHHCDKDEDLLQQSHSTNHTKHTEDWKNIRMPELTPFSNTSPPMPDALTDMNEDQSTDRMDQFLLPSPQSVHANITGGMPLAENLNPTASQLSAELADSTP